MKALFVALALACALQAGGQERVPRYMLAVQPFRWITGEFGLDFDRRMENPRHWVQARLFALAYDDNEGEVFAEDFTRMRGAGVEGAYKVFFYRRFYCSGGGGWRLNRVRYKEDMLHAYEEDGLTFHEYLFDQPARRTFNKLSVFGQLGVQTTFESFLFMDAYLGIGYAYSFRGGEGPAFNGDIYSFGYRGLFPRGGLRFGVSF
jgi:hypothetical protein